jgi:type II secretory ATPase GspE/PulE/Tfp pilus assembly ATPase PilB-like protein
LGHIGRTGLFEVWRLDDEDYHLVLNHQKERTIRQRLVRRGHEFLITDALAKAESGFTSISELRVAGGLRFGERSGGSPS